MPCHQYGTRFNSVVRRSPVQAGDDNGAIYVDECDYESRTNKTTRPLLIGGRTDVYTQTFRIDSEGTTTVEKFGWRMTRSRWSTSATVEKIK